MAVIEADYLNYSFKVEPDALTVVAEDEIAETKISQKFVAAAEELLFDYSAGLRLHYLLILCGSAE